ncbi:MAG: methyltransferase [Citrobacter freundii]|nr:MAG: methyltransferase [Citrobacter freundii]
MPNNYFQFKQFTVHQQMAAMKVTTDACLFGAWAVNDIQKNFPPPSNALDIGAGTGLLSLMIAQKVNAQIDAIEIDKNAFDQTEENFNSSPWSNRLKAVHNDIKNASLPLYDIIISNPPFYENDLGSPDQKRSSAHHDSTLLLSELIGICKFSLQRQGSFYLLLPFKRLEEVKLMINGKGMTVSRICNVRQSTNHTFFRSMLIIKHSTTDTQTEEMSIRQSDNEYSAAFTALLKDYYLYL